MENNSSVPGVAKTNFLTNSTAIAITIHLGYIMAENLQVT